MLLWPGQARASDKSALLYSSSTHRQPVCFFSPRRRRAICARRVVEQKHRGKRRRLAMEPNHLVILYRNSSSNPSAPTGRLHARVQAQQPVSGRPVPSASATLRCNCLALHLFCSTAPTGQKQTSGVSKHCKHLQAPQASAKSAGRRSLLDPEKSLVLCDMFHVVSSQETWYLNFTSLSHTALRPVLDVGKRCSEVTSGLARLALFTTAIVRDYCELLSGWLRGSLEARPTEKNALDRDSFICGNAAALESLDGSTCWDDAANASQGACKSDFPTTLLPVLRLSTSLPVSFLLENHTDDAGSISGTLFLIAQRRIQNNTLWTAACEFWNESGTTPLRNVLLW
ncbi:hypothetical protein BJ546DRAFT_947654 [Cryomyces antarcticus]